MLFADVREEDAAIKSTLYDCGLRIMCLDVSIVCRTLDIDNGIDSNAACPFVSSIMECREEFLFQKRFDSNNVSLVFAFNSTLIVVIAVKRRL